MDIMPITDDIGMHRQLFYLGKHSNTILRFSIIWILSWYKTSARYAAKLKQASTRNFKFQEIDEIMNSNPYYGLSKNNMFISKYKNDIKCDFDATNGMTKHDRVSLYACTMWLIFMFPLLCIVAFFGISWTLNMLSCT